MLNVIMCSRFLKLKTGITTSSSYSKYSSEENGYQDPEENDIEKESIKTI